MGMDFETTMRVLLGESAYHIEDAAAVPKYRRQWLVKATRKLMKAANALDTTPHHKELLLGDLDAVREHLRRIEEPTWALVYALLRFAARLLGFEWANGVQLHSPIYARTWSQYYTGRECSGGSVGESYRDKQNAIAVRRRIVRELAKSGIDDFKISLVLNTTEYEVKALRSEGSYRKPDAPKEDDLDP